MERYTSSDMEQKREAVRKLDAALRPRRKPAGVVQGKAA